MEAIHSDIYERLKKLLSLSRGATGAEAETALAMAMKLATKHEIDISTVQLTSAEQKKEEMVNQETMSGNRLPVCQKWISWILQDHFKVNIIYGGSRYGGRIVYLLGRKSDVEFAKYVQDFLREHMMRSWKYYQQTNNSSTRFRATYFSGFHRGLSQKLDDAKKAQREESFSNVPEANRAEVESRYGLVVISEKDARKSFVDSQFQNIRSVRSSCRINYDSNVNSAGFTAGRSTNIARPLK